MPGGRPSVLLLPYVSAPGDVWKLDDKDVIERSWKGQGEVRQSPIYLIVRQKMCNNFCQRTGTMARLSSSLRHLMNMRTLRRDHRYNKRHHNIQRQRDQPDI